MIALKNSTKKWFTNEYNSPVQNQKLNKVRMTETIENSDCYMRHNSTKALRARLSITQCNETVIMEMITTSG